VLVGFVVPKPVFPDASMYNLISPAPLAITMLLVNPLVSCGISLPIIRLLLPVIIP
jgi:hypothetical protein